MLKRLGRLIQNFQLRDAVQPIVGNVVILVIVTNQVIFPLLGRHLIGRNDVHPFRAVGAGFNVMALVRSILQVLEAYLSASADGLVQQLDGEKELLVVGFVLRQAGDVLHPAAEIHIRQALQLVHQLLALAVRDVLGEQQAVNEQPQLAVGEVPLQIEVRPQVALLRLAGFGVRHHTDGLAVLDVVAAVHEVQNVPPNGFAVGGHVVFGFQDLGDVLLAQAVLLVGVLPQDVQNVHNQQLFRLFYRHKVTFSALSSVYSPSDLFSDKNRSIRFHTSSGVSNSKLYSTAHA